MRWCCCLDPPSKNSLTPDLKAQPDNTMRNQDFNSFSAFCPIPDNKMQIIVKQKKVLSLASLKFANLKQALLVFLKIFYHSLLTHKEKSSIC